MTDPNPDHDSQNMWDNEDEAKTSKLQLITRLRSIHDFEHDETEAVCEEAARELERLREAIQWVVRDAAYKAPEQMGAAMAARWIDRLQSALAPESRDG